jgi:hypothetical protein
MTELAKLTETEIAFTPARRTRSRRWSARLATLATACAMGSWALLVVIPVLVFLSWLTDLHLS